jgi:pimeloyl-ACP methyl ester carboxylesterase
MSHFVLVPGAWLGSWAWDRVVPLLEETGHSVTAVALPGLGDGVEGANGQKIDLDTHADAVAAAVEAAPAGADVVLVSHSYSGLPVLQAVDRLDGRVSRVVHVDSAVAETGQAFLDDSSQWARERLAAVAEAGGWWRPEIDQFEGQGFSDADRDMLSRRCRPHPGGTLTQPLHLSRPLGAVPTTYLHCLQDSTELDPDTAALAARHGWRVVHLDSGHWPMLTTPRMLVDALLAVPA